MTAREAWRRFATRATPEDRRLRRSLALTLAVIIALSGVAALLP